MSRAVLFAWLGVLAACTRADPPLPGSPSSDYLYLWTASAGTPHGAVFSRP